MSELAEIASLRAQEFDLKILEIFDPFASVDRFLGVPVRNKLERSDVLDAYVFTALNQPEIVYKQLKSLSGEKQLFMPDFFYHITKVD